MGMVEHFAGQDLSKGCRAGFLSANISSRGDVTMCTRDNRIVGNIKNTPFQDVWNSEAFKNARKQINREACRHCWQSCYAEASSRLNLSFHIKNLGTSLKEIGFTKHRAGEKRPASGPYNTAGMPAGDTAKHIF